MLYHIAIDPDTKGGWALFCNDKLQHFTSVQYDSDWDVHLYQMCKFYGVAFATIEEQHARPNSSKRGLSVHMPVFGSAITAVKCGGVLPLIIQPKEWQLSVGVYGLNRHIESETKRRASNLNTYAQHAKKYFPQLGQWDKKEQGDVFACALIGLAGHRLFGEGKHG